MPIFEYKCSQCGQKFEKLVRRKAGEIKIKCPQCQSTKTKKLISSFRMKGKSGSSSCQSCTTGSCKSCI